MAAWQTSLVADAAARWSSFGPSFLNATAADFDAPPAWASTQRCSVMIPSAACGPVTVKVTAVLNVPPREASTT